MTPDPRGGYLLVRPRGGIYRLTFDDQAEMRVQDLGLRVPINTSEFEADVPDDVITIGFRVADLAARRVDNGVRMLASHHYWNPRDRCVVVRLSSITLPGAGAGDGDSDGAAAPAGGAWRTIHDTKPCLPLQRGRGTPFVGEHIGGMIAFLDDDRVLLTVGDHQFDGWNHTPDYVQDRAADYGKVLRIDTRTGVSSMFSLGHRNQQGLVIDRAGRIWATEHGPQGGDELNLVRAGRNYGWPFRTYGTEYGGVTWPHGAQAPRAASFAAPAFAWVPSIGITGVVSVNDSAFSRWAGDLLIASFTETLWRVRLEGDRVAYTEPIAIGERMRGIATSGGGDVVLWTDRDAIVRLTQASQLDTGAEAFTLTCGGCHYIKNDRNAIGPSLRAIVGRPVASRPGYGYSDALGRVGGEWTESRLDAFLANPDSVAPGTTMRLGALRDSASRRRILEYLKAPE